MSNMSSRSAAVVPAGAQHVRAARGGLPRPRRPSRPVPSSPRQRPAGCRVSGGGGNDSGTSGRAGSSFSWWGTGGQPAAGAVAPRRQACRGGAGRPSAARVPTGNRELVRRALSPPATSGRGAALRRWSFRPTPSRLRNVSCFSSTAAPASPRPS